MVGYLIGSLSTEGEIGIVSHNQCSGSFGVTKNHSYFLTPVANLFNPFATVARFADPTPKAYTFPESINQPVLEIESFLNFPVIFSQEPRMFHYFFNSLK